MTKETRELMLLEANINLTKAKKRGLDLLVGFTMIVCLVLLLLGMTNYAVLCILLASLGLNVSNGFNTRIQLLEKDLTEKALENVLKV